MEGVTRWPRKIVIPECVDSYAAPEHLRCPITKALMLQPAITPAGITYERDAIARWIGSVSTEPSTKQDIRVEQLYPNLLVRYLVEQYVSEMFSC